MKFGTFVSRGLAVVSILMPAIVALPPQAAADEGPWTVRELTGEARLVPMGGRAVALEVGDAVEAGDEVETGAEARLVLVRDEAAITVSPASRMAIPKKPSTGLTTIVQKLGTLLLKVNRRPQQHFEVSTPFLAAVVKGTTFTVSVDADGAAVHVVEGLVEVTDIDTRQSALVRPGQTARTTSAPGAGLSVGRGNGGANGKPDDRSDAGEQGDDTPGQATRDLAQADDGAPGFSENAPGRQGKAEADGAPGNGAAAPSRTGRANALGNSGRANGKGNGVAITQTLGAGKIDIAKVTNGLVGSIGTPHRGNGVGGGSLGGNSGAAAAAGIVKSTNSNVVNGNPGAGNAAQRASSAVIAGEGNGTPGNGGLGTSGNGNPGNGGVGTSGNGNPGNGGVGTPGNNGIGKK